MKNRIKLIAVLVILSAIIINNSIFASTTTYDREEEDNYGVPSSIVVSGNNRNIVLKTPLVNADEKVYDFANLLTDSEEEQLYNSIETYIENYNMDMVIVTINENNKYSEVEYADDFYDYNDFGIGSNRDGILFLIDMDNRQMHITTTGEAIRVYDDARIEDILDDTYYYISKSQYYECANAFIKTSSRYAKAGVPSSNKNTRIDEEGNYVVEEPSLIERFPILPITIVAIGVTGLFVLIASGKHKVIRKATQAKAYLVRGSFKLSNKEDKFIGSHTSKVYDPPSSSSSGGGGGSSTHSSSSGSSHGGGSRGF